MQSTTTLELNLQYPNHATTMYAVQNDRLSRKISAVLADGATAWTPPTGSLAIVRFVKPDGTMGFYDTDENDDPAVTWTGNVATITLAEQVLTVAGDVWCQVNFYNAGEERLSTFKWVIKVQENVITDETIESTDYFNILTHQIDEIIEAITDMPIPSTSDPLMDGTASPGSAPGFARGDHVHPSDTSRVPITRKVNNKALSSDITLSANDVGAVPTTRKVNNRTLSEDITLSASDVGAVPTTRTVNGEALSNNITLNASNIPNDSTVSGENVDDALDNLNGAIDDLEINVERNKFNGKKVLIIGDSWASGVIGDGTYANPTWCQYLTTLLNLDSTIIRLPGAGFTQPSINNDNPSYVGETFSDALEHVKDDEFDYIIVEGGANDIRLASSLDAINTGINAFGTKCQTYFPDVPIYYFPAYASSYIDPSRCSYVERVLAMAFNNYFITCADSLNWCLFYPTTHGADSLHLSQNGYNVFTRFMRMFLLYGRFDAPAVTINQTTENNPMPNVAPATNVTVNASVINAYKDTVSIALNLHFNAEFANGAVLMTGLPAAKVRSYIYPIPESNLATSYGVVLQMRENGSVVLEKFSSQTVNGKGLWFRGTYESKQNGY